MSKNEQNSPRRTAGAMIVLRKPCDPMGASREISQGRACARNAVDI